LLLLFVAQAGAELRLLTTQVTAEENDFFAPIALRYRVEAEQDIATVEAKPLDIRPFELPSEPCRDSIQESRSILLASEHPLFAFMSLQP
jgi:hypothetical protein